MTDQIAATPTPDEAAATLAERKGDQAWVGRFLSGNGPEVAEYRTLSEIALKSGDKTGDRLKFLDGIAATIDGPVTAEVVAAIEPADAVGVKMIREIMKLPVERQTRAFDDGDVFRLLAQLNPSLLTALKLCRWCSEDRERMGDA